MSNKNTFASFWHGRNLSPYEYACISSFITRGYDFTVYSYVEINDLPIGVINGDASTVVPSKLLESFLVNGTPSITAFSDYFRLMMFQKTDHIWSDLDVVLLDNMNFKVNSDIIGCEDSKLFNGAILRLDRDSKHFHELILKVESYKDRSMAWGDIGPKLLTRIYGKDLKSVALSQRVFYPIHYNDYYKVFMPRYLDECRALCKQSLALHLWNNIIVKSGIWKEIGPPVDSYLYEIFDKANALSYFKSFYPETVMNILLHNYLSIEGADLGISRLLKQFIPSSILTVRRHILKQTYDIFEIRSKNRKR